MGGLVGGCDVEGVEGVEGRVGYAVGEKKRRTCYVDFIVSSHTATVHLYTVSCGSVLFLDYTVRAVSAQPTQVLSLPLPFLLIVPSCPSTNDITRTNSRSAQSHVFVRNICC